MDDQFGGRTDDDLFADEFEPVAEEPEAAAEATQEAPIEVSTQGLEAPAAAAAAAASRASPAPPVSSKPISATPPSAPSAPRGLRQSRHAHSNNKPAPAPRPPRQQQQPPVAKTTSSAATSSEPPASTDASASATASTSGEANTADDKDNTAQTTTTQPTPPTATPAGTAAPRNGATDKPDREARLKSGANPRTKLTEEELAAKMEQMRILSAEKTRRFEQAQRDESDHAVAYARGMEEARKRRAAEDEKRRKGEEERRRMDDERARNRERKLAALGQKEGGWDLGRDHEEEAEERRAFRSAHGGVRGARSGAGLAGSRFASVGDEQPEGRRDFGGGDRGGRGRGRGRGGRGRGGLFDDRGGEDRREGNGHNGTSRAPPTQKPPAVDDFPALPSSGVKKTTAQTKTPLPSLDALSPLSPQVGGWDDEMAAMDAKQDA
ncbi:hypothetical protein BR93DRAFT_368107 [Coniochaeta sp. PMI_546]|nr:hypothetical protein BR93DRAFT_368107 [Coniochaeta sp. PMI_546]